MGKVTAIILSAGKGKRMGTEVAKQYLEVYEKPILYYSIKAFEESNVDNIVLVTGKEEQSYCEEMIVNKYGLKKVTKIVAGGRERYDSVYNGLLEIEDCNYVLIHDGARPCISTQVINETIHEVKEKKACVVGVPVKDTIKVVSADGKIKATPDRSKLMITQTPQAFQYEIVKEAYDKLYREGVTTATDDAMVVETMLEQQVYMIPGSYENIKVTTIEDLKVIERFLEK